MERHENKRGAILIDTLTPTEWVAAASIVGVLISIIMMIGSTVYLNKSAHRFRFFELGYSKNSDWYKSGKVDFFTTNIIMSNAIIAAIVLKKSNPSSKLRKNGAAIAPVIHVDENYVKLLDEFPWLVRWELVKFIIGVPSLLAGMVVASFLKI